MAQKKEEWVQSQIRSFTAWANYHLAKRDLRIDNVCEDFKDGTKLLHLVEILYNDTAGKHYVPKTRTFCIENANIALQFMKRKGMTLHGVSAEDIVDGNIKMILGMTWTVARHFEFLNEGTSTSEESEEPTKPSAETDREKEKRADQVVRDMLRQFLLQQLLLLPPGGQNLDELTATLTSLAQVEDLREALRDGRLLAAVIYSISPDQMPEIAPSVIQTLSPLERLERSMTAAERVLGIPKIVEPEEMEAGTVDEKSLLLCLSMLRNWQRESERRRELELKQREEERLVILELARKEEEERKAKEEMERMEEEKRKVAEEERLKREEEQRQELKRVEEERLKREEEERILQEEKRKREMERKAEEERLQREAEEEKKRQEEQLLREADRRREEFERKRKEVEDKQQREEELRRQQAEDKLEEERRQRQLEREKANQLRLERRKAEEEERRATLARERERFRQEVENDRWKKETAKQSVVPKEGTKWSQQFEAQLSQLHEKSAPKKQTLSDIEAERKRREEAALGKMEEPMSFEDPFQVPFDQLANSRMMEEAQRQEAMRANLHKFSLDDEDSLARRREEEARMLEAQQREAERIVDEESRREREERERQERNDEKLAREIEENWKREDEVERKRRQEAVDKSVAENVEQNETNEPLGGHWTNGVFVGSDTNTRYNPISDQDQQVTSSSKMVQRRKKGFFSWGDRVMQEMGHELDKMSLPPYSVRSKFKSSFRFRRPEKLVDGFPVKFASGAEIMLIGYLFVTENYLCFYGSIPGVRMTVTLALTDITKIEKGVARMSDRYKKVPTVLPATVYPYATPNSLLVYDKNHNVHRFFSISSSSKAYWELWERWEAAKRRAARQAPTSLAK